MTYADGSHSLECNDRDRVRRMARSCGYIRRVHGQLHGPVGLARLTGPSYHDVSFRQSRPPATAVASQPLDIDQAEPDHIASAIRRGSSGWVERCILDGSRRRLVLWGIVAWLRWRCREAWWQESSALSACCLALCQLTMAECFAYPTLRFGSILTSHTDYSFL